MVTSPVKIRPRLRMRGLLGLVALSALLLWAGVNRFDPVRRWHNAIHDDNDGPRRWEAVSLAAQGRVAGIDGAAAVRALVDALSDPSFRVRQTAAAALGRFNSPNQHAGPALIRALKDPEFTVRSSAAGSLGVVVKPTDPGNPAAVSALTAALKDPNAGVRQEAARSLATLGESGVAVPVLLTALSGQNDSPLERHLAIYHLGRMGRPAAAAVPALCALADRPPRDDEDETTGYGRVYAAEALFRLDPTEANLARLRRVADAPSVAVRQEAVKILERLVPGPDARGTEDGEPD